VFLHAQSASTAGRVFADESAINSEFLALDIFFTSIVFCDCEKFNEKGFSIKPEGSQISGKAGGFMLENNGFTFESLHTGMSAEFSKTITETDIVNFAGISGDFNPIHINEEFARKTRFEGRIAHGMLSAAFISTVLGTRLPGPGCIYVSQTLKFKAPVRIGDTVTAHVEISDMNTEKSLVTMKTICLVGDKTVIDGEAVLKVPRRETAAKEH